MEIAERWTEIELTSATSSKTEGTLRVGGSPTHSGSGTRVEVPRKRFKNQSSYSTSRWYSDYVKKPVLSGMVASVRPWPIIGEWLCAWHAMGLCDWPPLNWVYKPQSFPWWHWPSSQIPWQLWREILGAPGETVLCPEAQVENTVLVVNVAYMNTRERTSQSQPKGFQSYTPRLVGTLVRLGLIGMVRPLHHIGHIND